MKIKIDPIIAVKDVEASSKWYQQLLGLQNAHGGMDFAVLIAENEAVVLCLHQWGAHGHPTMMNPDVPPGNGLMLYIKTDNMSAVRKNAEKFGIMVEEDIHPNPNSLKKEFSLRDPDGYYLTIAEYHEYEG